MLGVVSVPLLSLWTFSGSKSWSGLCNWEFLPLSPRATSLPVTTATLLLGTLLTHWRVWPGAPRWVHPKVSHAHPPVSSFLSLPKNPLSSTLHLFHPRALPSWSGLPWPVSLTYPVVVTCL